MAFSYSKAFLGQERVQKGQLNIRFSGLLHVTHTLEGKKYRMKRREETVKENRDRRTRGKAGQERKKEKIVLFFFLINHYLY